MPSSYSNTDDDEKQVIFKGLKYTLPRSGEVILEVFDLLGRRIAQLEEGYQNPGEYTIHFDQRGLAGGVYFLRLQAGDFTAVQKMVILK